MRNRYLALIVLAVILALLAGCAPAQQAGDQGAAEPEWKTKSYSWAMGPTTAADYLWAAITTSIITRETGIKFTILESAGTEENMHTVDKKVADFGHADTVLIERDFGKDNDFRIMFSYMAAVWQFPVANDANINSLKDLDGKKWNPGPAGGGSTHVTEQIIEALGIKPDMYNGTLNDAAEAYQDRQIVGLSYRGNGATPTGAFVESHAARPLHFLNISDEELAKIQELFPYLGRIVIPPGVYPDQTEPIQTFGAMTSAEITRKDVPAEVVYEITKSYWENHETIAKQYPGAGPMTAEVAVKNAAFYLHPGAIKYYEEIGIEVPDNLIPPEAKQ